MDGFCWQCQDYFLTQLDARPGEWVDTGRVPQLLTREENARRLKILGKIVSGEMSKADTIKWCLDMEKAEPGIGWRKAAFDLQGHIKGINARYAPRWLKRDGIVVGKTPLGDDILGFEAGIVEEEVPF
jgi:hypothetical protein